VSNGLLSYKTLLGTRIAFTGLVFAVSFAAAAALIFSDQANQGRNRSERCCRWVSAWSQAEQRLRSTIASGLLHWLESAEAVVAASSGVRAVIAAARM